MFKIMLKWTKISKISQKCQKKNWKAQWKKFEDSEESSWPHFIQFGEKWALLTDLSIYSYGATSADLRKIDQNTPILRGIVLDCSPVRANNKKKLGIESNRKMRFVWPPPTPYICAYFDIFIFGQQNIFSFRDRFDQNKQFLAILKIKDIDPNVPSIILVFGDFLFMCPKKVPKMTPQRWFLDYHAFWGFFGCWL